MLAFVLILFTFCLKNTNAMYKTDEGKSTSFPTNGINTTVKVNGSQLGTGKFAFELQQTNKTVYTQAAFNDAPRGIKVISGKSSDGGTLGNTGNYNMSVSLAKGTTVANPSSGVYDTVNFNVRFLLPAHYVGNGTTSECTFKNSNTMSSVATHGTTNRYVNASIQCSVYDCALVTHKNIRYCNVNLATLNLKRPVHTVYANNTGGTGGFGSTTRNCGEIIGNLTKPVRTGYAFSGWSYQNGGPVNVSSSDMVCASKTIYAVWTPIYTVSFTDGLGKVLSTQSVIKGNSATAPAAPSRTGYDFAGWDRSYTNVTGNITVNATWTPKKVTYTFDGNGGTGTMSNLVVPYGGSGTLPSNAFTRKGYVFQGWSTSKRGTVEYQDKETVTNQKDSHSNVTLYAIWRKTNTSFSTIRVKEDDNVFTNDEKLTGGNGTAYDAGQTDSEYARTDTNEYPGYFSTK